MAEPIEKGEGLTASEKVLKELCERTFLSLWSFPNLFKRKGDELCDLLVVFGDHVIIFSDKSCAFPDTGDVDLDWSRWFRRSIEASAKQAFGAERWLKEQPHRVFLDAKIERKFPFDLPTPEKMKVHRIAVALGAAERCRDHFGGGSGSLMIAPFGGGYHQRTATPDPFKVGWPIPDRGYVHVFDDVTLKILLKELNTVSDFVSYLEKKEAFLGADRLGGACGEEDLLATYLLTLDDTGKSHEFPSFDGDLLVDEGHWFDFLRMPQYGAKWNADQVSFMWDTLIDFFSKHLVAGTLVAGSASVREVERPLRIMASEHRVARRMLSEGLNDLFERAVRNGRPRVVISPTDPTVVYVFCVDATLDESGEETGRDVRRIKMEGYAMVARHLNPGARHVIAIGVEPKGASGGSEDLIYLDTSEWSPEQEATARHFHENVGLLKRRNELRKTDHEFPINRQATPRRSKNQAKKERQNRARKAR